MRINYDLNQLPLLGLACVVFGGIFLGIFFGVNYPEIKIADFTPTKCLITNTTIISRYCSYTDCDFCTETSATSCNALINVFNNMNPLNCINGTNCPVDNQACGNGYKCCQQCCSTCTSCTSDCDSKGKCTQNCSNYQCNCYCCNSVNNNKCNIHSPLCYSTLISANYTKNTNIIKASYSRDFANDLNAAKNLQNFYIIGSNIRCYYNPNANSSDIV
jgi:hypothetical protein